MCDLTAAKTVTFSEVTTRFDDGLGFAFLHINKESKACFEDIYGDIDTFEKVVEQAEINMSNLDVVPKDYKKRLNEFKNYSDGYML